MPARTVAIALPSRVLSTFPHFRVGDGPAEQPWFTWSSPARVLVSDSRPRLTPSTEALRGSRHGTALEGIYIGRGHVADAREVASAHRCLGCLCLSRRALLSISELCRGMSALPASIIFQLTSYKLSRPTKMSPIKNVAVAGVSRLQRTAPWHGKTDHPLRARETSAARL